MLKKKNKNQKLACLITDSQFFFFFFGFPQVIIQVVRVCAQSNVPNII